VNPAYYIFVPLAGFLVGGLVSATGIGGGLFLLPLQVLGLGVSPIVAVGSDIGFMFFTKLWASITHGRKGNVDWPLVGSLATGSVPGSLAGIALLSYLRFRWGDGVNGFLRILIGILLVALPAFILIMDRLSERFGTDSGDVLNVRTDSRRKAQIIGLIGGFLVGLTSVGSGSIIILLLFTFYRRPTTVLVGSDILHGVILSGVLGIIHLHMGTMDLRLVGLLMTGSAFGVIYGSKITNVIPAVWLRRAILLLLIPLGIQMI
jgi:uncharacterized protein